MRVLHLDSGREWRGGQTQLLHLARRMPGCAVALPPEAPLRPALEAAGVRVHPVRFGVPLAGGRDLRRAIRAFGPDLLAAHTSAAHALALQAPGRPLVVHRRLDFRPHRWSRPKYARAARYVAVSRAVRRVLVGYGIPGARIDVVLDGVEAGPLRAATPDPDGLRAELGLGSGDRLALAVGALVPHKGHRHAVEALARTTGWHLLLAGEGPLAGALRALAARRGVGRRLHLLGPRRDVPRLLKSVDLLVHPSVEEGMGQAVAEALVAGCPVLATRAGGLPEVVGPHGLLVPPADPAALAGALGAAAARRPDPALQAARFEVGRMVHQTIRAYARVPLG